LAGKNSNGKNNPMAKRNKIIKCCGKKSCLNLAKRNRTTTTSFALASQTNTFKQTNNVEKV